MSRIPLPILVATDLSARSERALRRSFALARAFKHSLAIVAVQDGAMPPDIAPELHERARRSLARNAASLGNGVDYDLHAETGKPTARIVDIADNIDAGLIVLGLHRHRAFLDVLRETTGQRIARLSQRPVLIVLDFIDHDYRNIVASCDFTSACAAAIRMAATLSHAPRITPVHTLHVPFKGILGHDADSRAEHEAPYHADAQARDARWRARENLPDCVEETEFVTGAPLDILHRRTHGGRADLLCVGAHGRATALPAMFGSLTEDLMRTPPCDLLVVGPD